MLSFSSHSLSNVSTLSSAGGGFVGLLRYNQCEHYNTMEDSLSLGALGLNAFKLPWQLQVSYVFPLTLVSIVPSRFMEENLIG